MCTSQQHLQCSWVWAGTSGHAPSRETGPLSHPRPAAPRCCTTSPGSACAFALRGCGWCSAPRPGTATPSLSGRRGRHLHAQHAQKWWIYAYEFLWVSYTPVRMYTVCLNCWVLCCASWVSRLATLGSCHTSHASMEIILILKCFGLMVGLVLCDWTARVLSFVTEPPPVCIP